MDIPKPLDDAVERYNENLVLRPIAVALIPVVGGALDAFITARAARLQRERFDHFVEGVSEAYERLDEAKLDKQFVQSEEFFELFVSTVERVVRAHQSEKLEALRNAFVNATTLEGSRGPIKDIVVRLAGELTASHMRVLRVAADRERAFTQANRDTNEDYVDVGHFRAGGVDLSDPEIRFVANDLINMGLLRNWWIGRYGGPEGQEDRCALSEVGERFIWFIHTPGEHQDFRR